MSIDRLVSWATSEAVEAFDLSTEEAHTLALEVAKASPPALRAGEFVGLCRATKHLGWVAQWWTTEAGRRAFAELTTCPDLAWAALNELCAVPAPDALDPNWPDAKVFTAVETPEGSAPHDEFVVGDGEGARYLMRVVERQGQVGVEVVQALGAPLDSYLRQCVAEAEGILRRP